MHEDLGFGEMPEGWSNQLDNDVLVNLNYEYRRKLWTSSAKYETNRWGRDLSVGTQIGVGTFATYAQPGSSIASAGTSLEVSPSSRGRGEVIWSMPTIPQRLRLK